MLRRAFFSSLSMAVLLRGASATVRGKLAASADPHLATEARNIKLAGDAPTMGVLRDERLQGADLELLGTAGSPDSFTVDMIHTRSMFVHKDGKRLFITYWCDVCYIRTYTPGICWCCQKETDLELRESLTD